jgi:site-specific recombinase XerD
MISSLAQAISAYRTIAASDGKSANTIEWVTGSSHYLEQFLGDNTLLEEISVYDIRRWVMAMRQKTRWAGRPGRGNSGPLSSTSINNYVRGVKLLLSTLAKEGLIAPHPVASMPAPKPAKAAIKPFAEYELRRIFKALGETKHPHRNRAVVGLLFDPGLRLSEAVGLKRADVDLAERSIVVWRKGGKQQVLPLSAWTARLLLMYTAKERPNLEDPYLFMEDDGRPLTGHAVQEVLRRLSKVLKIRIHAHRFRHTGSIEYLRSGGDSLFLQQLLGHSDLAMTKRYASIAGVDLKAAHRKFSPGDRLRL